MVLVFSILFYFLVQRWKWTLWLILPFSLFLDLWGVKKLGVSGLKILLIISIFWLVFGIKVKENLGGGGLKIR